LQGFAAHGFFAAQVLQPRFAAHGLQPRFAAHGLQFLAAHGLQLLAAHGLLAAKRTSRGTTH
jgi:hypothetical protein